MNYVSAIFKIKINMNKNLKLTEKVKNSSMINCFSFTKIHPLQTHLFGQTIQQEP